MNKDESTKQIKFINVTFVSGLITGAINKFVNHPIDTVKVKVNVILLDSKR